MPTCVACDTPLLPGRSFCGECGTPVPAEPPPSAEPVAPAAPACQCGAPLTGAFCGECGTPRPQSAEPPAPAATPAPTWSSDPARQPRRSWPILALAGALVLLGAATLVGTLGMLEALVLFVLAVVAIVIAAGLSGVPSGQSDALDPAAALMLTDPDLGDRQLVYSRFGIEHGPVTATELARVAADQGLPPTTQVRDTAGGAWFPLGELVRTSSAKSFGVTLALTFFLGALGAHWFYLRRPGLGLLRLLTWGGVMVLAVVAISQIGQTTYGVYDPYDPYYDPYSGGPDGGLLVALWVASGVIALWTLLDLILVATRSARDGDGRRLV